MKLVKKQLDKHSGGFVVLVPQDREDIWTIYNLVQSDDEVELLTTRNVKKMNKDGSFGKSEKKTLKLRLKVVDVDYESSEELMRVKGLTVNPVDDVPLNSYHTAEIGLNQKCTIFKDQWDQVSLDLIDKACSLADKAEVGAVVLEEGVAHICLITDNMTSMVNKVEKSIPKKRRGDSKDHDRAVTRFLEMTADSIRRNLPIEKLKAIILASPGFLSKNLYDTIFAKAAVEGDKGLLQMRSKFVVTQSSTGYLQGLDELMGKPEIQQRLADTKFAKQKKVLEEFLSNLNADNGKAYYGPQELQAALELGPGVIKTLLISDALFRSSKVSERKHYIEVVEQVNEYGGEVLIFSSLHESGIQIDQLTGIGLILNYPVYDLGQGDEEEDDEEEEEDYISE